MKKLAKKILFFILFFIFLFLAAACLLTSIALGVVAIFVGSNGERDVSYYWMIGSSAVLLPFPLFATITIRFLVDFLILLGLEEVAKKKGSDEGTEMVELPDGDDDDSEDKFVEAEFYNYYIRIVRSDKFNPLSIGAAIFTFIAFVFFILALVGLMWMILVAYNFYNVEEQSVWPYIVTELVIGLVCPVFVFVGATFFAIVIGFITAGQVDPKLAVKQVLPSVQLVQGELVKTHETQKYWVVSEQFYMRIRKPFGEKGDLRHAIDPSTSTWLLVVISGLAVILAVSYFVNQNVAQALTVPIQEVIEESDICINYNCFADVTFMHINCTNTTSLVGHSFLHCFRFLRLGMDADLITTLGVTVGFFLATVHFFKLVFVITNILLHIRQTKLWGILISIVGVGIFVGSLVVLFSPHFVPLHLDVIKVGQFIILSIYCFLIGILLCTGEVREIVKEPIKRKRTITKPEDLRAGADRQDERDARGRDSIYPPLPGATNV